MRRLLIAMATLAAVLPARAEPVRPPWYVKPMALDTGFLANWSEAETVAIDEVIGEAGAPWIQVRLAGWNLGEQSRLYLTSMEDGDTQVHTAATLRTWQGRSAIFRGGLVRVQLVVAPGEENVYAELVDPVVGHWVEGTGGASESLCGGDDRVETIETRVGRLYFGGCTVFYAPNGACLTAGHCVDFDPDGGGAALPDGVLDLSNSDIVEINPPASTAGGTPVPAAVNNQYPVIAAGTLWHYEGENQGLGKDYGIFHVGRNSNTGLTPHEAGGFYRFNTDSVTVGNTIRVTGYGADSGTANKTNQTSTGPYEGLHTSGSNIWHGYQVDTTGASSGSPIYHVSTASVVGVHTNAGCAADGSGYNSGTSFRYASLTTGLQNWLGGTTFYADANHPDTAQTGSIFDPFLTVTSAASSATSGSILGLVEGRYTKAAGNTFIVGTGNKALTIVAPVGAVIIGD